MELFFHVAVPFMVGLHVCSRTQTKQKHLNITRTWKLLGGTLSHLIRPLTTVHTVSHRTRLRQTATVGPVH